MPIKIVVTFLLLALQAALIYAIRRMPTSTMIRWRLMHFRGEEWSESLRQAGEEMRKNREDSRSPVVLGLIMSTLPIDAIVAVVWLID